MTVVIESIIGGIVGVLFAVMAGDPFRDSGGRFVGRGEGFLQWIISIVISGILGMAIGPAVIPKIERSIWGIGALIIIGYLVYRTYVDPR